MSAKRDAGRIEGDGDTNTTPEGLGRRLEDAVERSIFDIEAERTAPRSLRPVDVKDSALLVVPPDG